MKFVAQLLFAVILGALIITGLTARYLPPHHVIARVNALSDPDKVRWTAQSVSDCFPGLGLSPVLSPEVTKHSDLTTIIRLLDRV